MKEQKLKEFLLERTEEKVCLATKSGSNWIWIGSGQEVIDRLSRMDEYFKNYYEKEMKRSFSKYEEEINEVCDNDIKRLRNLESAVADFRKYVRYKNHLVDWADFGERPVVETYQTESNGLAIVVSGIEHGTLWWKGEHSTIFD